MFVRHIHSALLVTALSSLPFLATAQNAPVNATACSYNIGSYDSDASVNSTGKIKFKFDNDDTKYYLSVTLNDTRRQSTELVTIVPEVLHDVQGWLSFPNDTSGYACVYKLSALNASSPDGGRNGCDGVLSTECVNELSKLTLPAGSDGSMRCPPFPTSDSIKDVCHGIGENLVTSDPIDLSDSNCSISSPQGISVPDDYRTMAAMGFGAAPGQSDSYGTFENYDLFVRQTIPWVIASTSGRSSDGRSRQSRTQVVCVSPDTVLPGSRIPDLQFGTWEEENAAAGGANWRVAERLAVLVAGSVSLGFVMY